jgi:glycosyltransferase involved in cell wall biosynthesis
MNWPTSPESCIVVRSIYFYADSGPFGGVEQALLTLLENLDRGRWRPTLLLEESPQAAELARRAIALAVPVLPISPMPLGVVGARRTPRLVRTLRAQQPDVFHAHLSWPLAAKYPLLAAIAARVPAVVATVQLIPEFRLDRSNFLQLRAMSSAVGRYIAVSRSIAAELSARFRWPERKIEVIHNAVAVGRVKATRVPAVHSWLTQGRPWPVVLTCARLDPQKGHLTLLRAAAELPDTIFAIAGEGPDRPRLELAAAALGIADRVRFLGFRVDIPELLAATDVFALPSLYEGSPLAVLEAMAAGVPVVSSRIGGTDELIEDGDSGLLVRPADHLALATALRRLLGDEVLRRSLSQHGRERVAREFAASPMARRVTRVYEDLLNDGGRLNA